MNDARDSRLAQTPRPLAELPPGWRSAEAESCADVDHWARARRRRRLVIIAAVTAVLLLEAVGVVVWNAQAHYGRGQSALAAGADALAVEEFSQATLLGLPYRDAATLEQRARASLTSDVAEREAEGAQHDRVLARLTRAAAALRSGEADAVLAAAEAAGRLGLVEVAAGSQDVADAERQLVEDTALAARAALAGGAWKDAGLLAAALIALDGTTEEWTRLSRSADKGARLAATLERARAAAELGSWRTALRIARQVLAENRDFPGAARVAARAQAALAAAQARAAQSRAARARAAAAANAGNGGTSGGTQTTTPATSGTGTSSTQPPPP
jgi:tetratricopeptide (TPR) repeat protein